MYLIQQIKMDKQQEHVHMKGSEDPPLAEIIISKVQIIESSSSFSEYVLIVFNRELIPSSPTSISTSTFCCRAVKSKTWNSMRRLQQLSLKSDFSALSIGIP